MSRTIHDIVDKSLLDGYIGKYYPIPLPIIFKETDKAIAIKTGDDFSKVNIELTAGGYKSTEYKTQSEKVFTYVIFDSRVMYTNLILKVQNDKITKISIYEEHKDAKYRKTEPTLLRYSGDFTHLTVYSSLSGVYERFDPRSNLTGNIKNLAREVLKRN